MKAGQTFGRSRYFAAYFIAAVAAAAGLLGVARPTDAQNLPTRRVLTLDIARAVAQGAMDKCRADGQHVSVTVLEYGNTVKAFLRDDGAGPHTPDLSRRKAYTALFFGRSTAAAAKALADSTKPYSPGVTEAAGGVPMAGGVPIKVGDETIGAVGVSGAQDDDACATAGVAKVADQLK